AGEPVIDNQMTVKLVEQFRQHGTNVVSKERNEQQTRLTQREREIMQCLARGDSNKAIARTLDVAESTVKIHVQNILKKLDLTSRVQIAVYAVEHGLVSE